MDFRDYLQILKRGWVSIVLFALVGVAVAASYLAVAPRTYEATSVVFVSTQSSDTLTELQQGNTYAQQAVKTYVQLAVSPVVLQPVIRQLDLVTTPSELAADLSVGVRPETTLFEITARNANAEVAAQLANAVAVSAINEIGSLESTNAADGEPLVKLEQIQDAVVPTTAISPDAKIDIALGLIVGLAVGLAATILVQALDTRIRTPRDLWSLTERPLLSRVPQRRSAKKHAIVIRDDPSSAYGESFRTLRTNLRFLETSTARSFVVTSAVAGEGKSSVAANLAWALAEAKYSVVLVDTDLRNPAVGRLFSVSGPSGLSEFIVGRAGLNDVLLPSGHELLAVMLAGAVPPNPSELLGSDEMGEVMKLLERRFDYVILDAPPLLSFTDAAVVSAFAAGTVITVAAGRTKREELSSALLALANVGVTPTGIVLNRVQSAGSATDAYVRLPDKTKPRVVTTDDAAPVDDPQYRRGRRALGLDSVTPE